MYAACACVDVRACVGIFNATRKTSNGCLSPPDIHDLFIHSHTCVIRLLFWKWLHWFQCLSLSLCVCLHESHLCSHWLNYGSAEKWLIYVFNDSSHSLLLRLYFITFLLLFFFSLSYVVGVVFFSGRIMKTAIITRSRSHSRCTRAYLTLCSSSSLFAVSFA